MTRAKPNWLDPVHVLAFGFGAGAAPKAPGTAGTLIGVLFYVLLSDLSLAAYLSLTCLCFVLGIWICEKTSRDLRVHDHGGIVWDEIVGYLVTMIGAPNGWQWTLLGFVVFRFLDIAKPWPIGLIDRRIKGGLGIMLDDLVAGLLAFGGMRLVSYLSS